MPSVVIDLLNGVPDPEEDPWLLIPRPIDEWHQEYRGLCLLGTSEVREIKALNSAQRAFLIKPESFHPPEIRFHLAKTTTVPPEWFWQQDINRYTHAAADLVELSRKLTDGCDNPSDRIQRLMEHTSELFDYGHRDRRLYDEADAVSCVCGVTQGSCVDINTYLMAAASSLNIPVQYMAGYWFYPGRTETSGMHCWLVFDIDNEPVFWDLAHHLKWGVDKLTPGLNPAGGRRVTMSFGRGLLFETPHGTVEISHFSAPVWILPEAQLVSPQLRITLEEND